MSNLINYFLNLTMPNMQNVTFMIVLYIGNKQLIWYGWALVGGLSQVVQIVKVLIVSLFLF